MQSESSRRRAATAMPKILACGRPSRNSVARMVPLPKVARGGEFAALAVGPNDRVFVLTGAGISAESGVRTFRDAGGLWEEHRIEDVAAAEGSGRDAGLVRRFSSARRRPGGAGRRAPA